MDAVSVDERKKRALRKYFGEKPKVEDLFGSNPFKESYEDLELLAKEYREWYKTRPHKWSEVPEKLKLPYQIHHNISSEIMSRAELLSKFTGKTIDETLEGILSVRSIAVPVDSFNGATIYASTIYRGKTQVNTGTDFERRITDFVNSIDPSIKMAPGKPHNGSKYDKDIYVNGEYRLSAEISFQVTTNSVMERKSHLGIPKNLTVIMIFGGLGWVERINALERIADKQSGYADCFGPSAEEMERLKRFLLSLKAKK